ncbi:MAG: CoA pyrophosphatase [Deltaproteobacteria bacterium]|nr:CoA pyrophosphatase [Deltaproteobacteria bacterium]
MTFERLRKALAARTPRDFDPSTLVAAELPPGGLAHASVLVPLLVRDGAPCVLLTRRHRHLPRHPGQVSFPGGRNDPGEESLAAALREAHEEIALEPDKAEVLGRLDETLVLASPFRLTPWVARVPYPYPYAGHPGEVDGILYVPLAALLGPGAHHVERHGAYGAQHEVHVYEVEGARIFGATAAVLWQLLEAWRTVG